MSFISNVLDFKRRESLENQSQWLPGQTRQRNILDQEEQGWTRKLGVDGVGVGARPEGWEPLAPGPSLRFLSGEQGKASVYLGGKKRIQTRP